MIYCKEWAVKKSGWTLEGNNQYYLFRGWFLFGVIPLYIRRFGK